MSWDLPREKTVDFRLLAEALGRCRTRWGGSRWKSQNRKNVYLSPYVEEPLNSKVIKSFVPELRSRYVFFEFRDSYVLSLWTFDVHFTHSHILAMVHFWVMWQPRRELSGLAYFRFLPCSAGYSYARFFLFLWHSFFKKKLLFALIIYIYIYIYMYISFNYIHIIFIVITIKAYRQHWFAWISLVICSYRSSLGVSLLDDWQCPRSAD